MRTQQPGAAGRRRPGGNWGKFAGTALNVAPLPHLGKARRHV